jgi:hypothetical protein
VLEEALFTTMARRSAFFLCGAIVGVLSNRLRAAGTSAIPFVVLAGELTFLAWPDLDVAKPGVGELFLVTPIWAGPSLGAFFLASFIVGRYGYRAISRLPHRSPAQGEDG